MLLLGALLFAYFAERHLTLAVYAPNEGEVHHFGAPVTGKKSRAAYDTHFRNSGHFAAFAMSETGRFGWVHSHSSVHAAKTNALAHCEATGVDCEVVAILVPRGYDPEKGFSLRHRDQEQLRKVMQGTGPRAVAVAENGSFSYRYSSNIWWAKLSAWVGCMSVCTDDQPDHMPLWPCKIVYAS